MVLLEVMSDILEILNAAAQKLSTIISDDDDSDWVDEEEQCVDKKKGGKVVCSCPFKDLIDCIPRSKYIAAHFKNIEEGCSYVWTNINLFNLNPL